MGYARRWHGIPIDIVVHEFNAGSTPEEIVLHYDRPRLDDAYFSIAYYLRHRAELDAYLAELTRQADAYQAEAEARSSWRELRLLGLLRRAPALDVVRIMDIGLNGVHDSELLERAAREGRVLVTRDTNTMIDFAWARVRRGLLMPGITAVRQSSDSPRN